MMHVTHEPIITREGLINSIKHLLAGNPPEALLNAEAQQALLGMSQECVTSGILNSREVTTKR
jgi:hypothetical protein